MTVLSNKQKQLLFDYCVGLTSKEETTEARHLISSNQEASEIYSSIKAALSPLDSLEPESCPDELAESTVWRLNNAARSSQLQLEQLLGREQSRSVGVKHRLWPSLPKRLATAAVFIIVGGVLIITFNTIVTYARQNYRQQQCRMQMARIFRGTNQYASDHDGKMPTVATASGAPWWKVGYQGKENHSNTRHVWLLVKSDYVNAADFVCPGTSQGQAIRLKPLQVQNYNDFPSRGYITYSFRIMSNSPPANSLGQKVLIADLNPLFERLPQDYSGQLQLRLNKELLTLNSINHNRRGQNILFGDGSVAFLKTRLIGIGADDIFTLQNTDIYQGVEVPSVETDAFVAP